MRFLLALFLSLAASAPAAPSCPVHRDILVRSDATLAPVRPVDCSTLSQTPPEFTWPPQNGSNVTYTLSLTLPGGKVESRTTTKNWMLWEHALPPGRYSWRIKASGANESSDPRTFAIAADAVPFVVPAPETLLQQARATPRPRTWHHDGANPIALMKSGRAPGFKAMLEEVQNKMPAPVQPEPSSGSIESNYDDTVAEQKRTLAAALAWVATHDRRYGADATRRVLAQARWNTNGTLAYKANDMGDRTVAWTLALAYDWLHDYLEPAQKATIAAAIRERTQPMFQDAVTHLAGYPYDSHGNITLTVVAAIGALMAGDIPEADAWVKEAAPLAVVWTSPWGWSDGGFGNGTAQMFWDTGSNLPAWHVLRNAAGLDLSKKEWVRNLPRFLAYFVPPGSPSGVFGDGLELDLHEVWARVSKALARFVPSPLARWYARSMKGEDTSRMELLMAPPVDAQSAPFPAGTPNGAFFASVGWVAMHSSLADPMRASVYFKSSPYGSYNHSHADQNSFVIHDHGKRLAIASGYYDGYKTPHWNEWYKQTRAANAITFDGGQGQGLNDKRFEGEVTRFETTPAYDFAIGRAEKAYDGALTRAERTIAFVRPDIVVVRDRLASATPRTWEWNIHAMENMERINERTVHVTNGVAQMCLEMVAAPEIIFRQTDQFTAPPQARKPPPRQWHGAFTSVAKSREAQFVAVMRIGGDCGPDSRRAVATHTPAGWQLDVAGRAITLGDDNVSVAAAGAPPAASPRAAR